MSYLRYLCLFMHCGVQHILRCFLALFVFVLLALWCRFLRIVHFWLRILVPNTYCVVFLFCISSYCVLYVASFSGLSILECPSVFSSVYLHLHGLLQMYLRKLWTFVTEMRECIQYNLPCRRDWRSCTMTTFVAEMYEDVL